MVDKAIFVNPYPHYAKGINKANIFPPLGIAYIAAVLEKKGYECKIIDANVLEMPNEKVIEIIKKDNPDVVCISINLFTALAGNSLAYEIKKKLDKKVIIGGVQASNVTERTLKSSLADAVVLGESEETILELVRKDCNPKGILGVAYLENDKVVYNGKRPLIENLDDLPWPAYHLLPPLQLYRTRYRKSPAASILTSRGCPYSCIFCSSGSKESVLGKKFRARSPENVAAEIDYLAKRFGVKQIDIQDDNFTFDMGRAEKICDLLIKKKNKVIFNFQNGVRADRLTRELVFKLKKAGWFKAIIGIESGDKKILSTAKKALDLEQAKKAIKWFREAGILVQGNFMFGLPEEDEETMQKTINFAIEANPHIASFGGAVPFPGTEFYDIIEKKGRFTTSVMDGMKDGYLAGTYPFELGKVNQDIIAKYLKMAYIKFYLRPSKILEISRISLSPGEIKWTLRSIAPLMKHILLRKSS